ncbi:SMI1/KNR4 family protein [Saccharibacillus alkalitolerans]|uniref:SMI1/KNR4 family protein n=1 Tax=Saccharibacillus alkalitolerans TaxID=2705290 RepID=A0ABX0F9P7_9BACL|nr:SMI1/KNR4 family protein [Saccharibacillus alkalitolerans]NGZ77663.1 SMI1/KNR4 family protein [Saccharibacillus alkalitolerans]
MNVSRIKRRLESKGVRFERGLTAGEIAQAERVYEFRFPPDLRELLEHALPAGGSFPNWRGFSEQNVRAVRERLGQPLEGILFDVRHNAFWHESWGERPNELREALKTAERRCAEWPRLIPIYSHRYLPETPNEAGNPVFSVYQTDVIYYGANLEEYLEAEFGLKPYENIAWEPVKSIEFWGEMTS